MALPPSSTFSQVSLKLENLRRLTSVANALCAGLNHGASYHILPPVPSTLLLQPFIGPQHASPSPELSASIQRLHASVTFHTLLSPSRLDAVTSLSIVTIQNPSRCVLLLCVLFYAVSCPVLLCVLSCLVMSRVGYAGALWLSALLPLPLSHRTPHPSLLACLVHMIQHRRYSGRSILVLQSLWLCCVRVRRPAQNMVCAGVKVIHSVGPFSLLCLLLEPSQLFRLRPTYRAVGLHC